MNARRTRLSPEARRQQLLDVARQQILKKGLQQFSLKRLAADAGVSEPLLFHYFASKIELLKQLLSRDYDRYLVATKESMKGAESLQEILQIFVSRNYDHYNHESIIDILLTEPEISAAVEDRRRAYHKQREKFLINTVASAYRVPKKNAAMLASMASAASFAAARFAHETQVERNESIETVMKFILAGFESAERSSGG